MHDRPRGWEDAGMREADRIGSPSASADALRRSLVYENRVHARLSADFCFSRIQWPSAFLISSMDQRFSSDGRLSGMRHGMTLASR